MAHTILIIEDEDRIAHWVQTYLERAGYGTLRAADGKEGLSLARSASPTLIVLDIMLPGLDGLTICRTLRRESDVPIIMLTARSADDERITGLEIGADDYIVKPFNPHELVARIRAVLRRVADDPEMAPTLCRGAICLQRQGHRCTVDGEPVALSRIQFAILETLMRHPNQTLTRDQLLDAAFDGDYDGFDRSLDAHIRRLRQRVERDSAAPRAILTVYGVGYKFVD